MIGELFIKEGLITPVQLKECIGNQKIRKNYMPLGEILINRKIITRDAVQKVLQKYKKNIPFGELLLNTGIITKKQLDKALGKQKGCKDKIGKILVDLKIISENNLINALSFQLGIPKILPAISIIDLNLSKGFNPEFLHKQKFLPAFKEENDLIVIMADPLDYETIDNITKTTKLKIVPAIASASDIQNTISIYIQKSSGGKEVPAPHEALDLIIGNTKLFEDKQDNIIGVLNFVISNAIIDRATDIHIEPQDKFLRVRYRIDGILSHKTDLPNSMASKLIGRIKALCGLDLAEKRKHQDGRIDAKVMEKDYSLRVSTYAAIWGENVVVRIQPRHSSIMDISKIGFSPINQIKFKKALDHPTGVILVTGPTGSGKTTTLYASLNYLNDLDRAIITVEDPVEYKLDGIIQATLAPNVGMTYPDYLRAMMRQDPDVLMIGEIRDVKAADAVIQASLTGHKVLSTFHTEDAVGAILRLMNMGIETFLIASTLIAVVAQRLVRVLCDNCKEEYKPSMKALSFFNSLKDKNVDQFKFIKSAGCFKCNQTGFVGMTGIHEILTLNDAIREEIINRSASKQIKSVARAHAGLLSMSEDGFYKALKGITTLEEVTRVVYRDDTEGLEPMSVNDLVIKCEIQSTKMAPKA